MTVSKKLNKEPKNGFKTNGGRLPAPKGNKYAAGPHKNSRNFVTQQLIASLQTVVTDPVTNKERTKIAIGCDRLADKVMTGDLEAIKYCHERIEGKAIQPIAGKFEHSHKLENLLPELTDKELEILERVSRKALELDGVKLIEAQPLK